MRVRVDPQGWGVVCPRLAEGLLTRSVPHARKRSSSLCTAAHDTVSALCTHCGRAHMALTCNTLPRE